jgi:hypothetical protein
MIAAAHKPGQIYLADWRRRNIGLSHGDRPMLHHQALRGVELLRCCLSAFCRSTTRTKVQEHQVRNSHVLAGLILIRYLMVAWVLLRLETHR